ncbi:hypothetical protein ACHAXT_011327 [Thalassiosira profunda]
MTAARALLLLAALASAATSPAGASADHALAGSAPRDRLKKAREGAPDISPPPGELPSSTASEARRLASDGDSALALSDFEEQLRRPNIATFTTTDYAERESRLYQQLREPAPAPQSTVERQQPDGAWPHSLTLVLYFDGAPEEVSWKLENRRTSAQLAAAAFGDYDASHASKTTVVPLDILTEEDYRDDWTGDAAREYRFVIWDMNGNGLCCVNGNGKYELYSKETLVASGASYGAIDEQFFSIDPRTFLGESGSFPVPPNDPPPPPGAPPPPPVPNGPSLPAVSASVPAPTNPPTPNPTPPPMPTLMQSFFCGGSFVDAEENCHRPCPTGSPAQCRNVDGEDFVCYASTTCRERFETPEPTADPTPEPSPGPTKFPTPTEPQPTPLPTPSPTDPEPTPGPVVIPNVDSNTWFCGVDWEWFEDNCDIAMPCPRGDAVDCPPNMACFDSTPCTLAPTSGPSGVPSAMPSEAPTPSPTRAPFRIQDLLISDFVPLAPAGEQEPGTTGGGGSGGGLALDVNEALESYSSLQYHFACGKSWAHADNQCQDYCLSGDKRDCPEGQECFANTADKDGGERCDLHYG